MAAVGEKQMAVDTGPFGSAVNVTGAARTRAWRHRVFVRFGLAECTRGLHMGYNETAASRRPMRQSFCRFARPAPS